MSYNMMEIMRKTTSNSYPDIPVPGEDGSHDRATHNMNYHVLVVFHRDQDVRPCRPVVSVIHLNSRPDEYRTEVLTNPLGSPILTTCQLCDTYINSSNSISTNHENILGVFALSITDEEARCLINDISEINTRISHNRTLLTERSNIILVPLALHKFIPYGMGSIHKFQTSKAVTDVELAILSLRESLNNARSIHAKLCRLHAAASTPVNLYDAISTFSRRIDLNSFRHNALRFVIP
jgi:hypothetical protein